MFMPVTLLIKEVILFVSLLYPHFDQLSFSNTCVTQVTYKNIKNNMHLLVQFMWKPMNKKFS